MDGRTKIRIGTAGWAIPRAVAQAFPVEGTGLQRYAGRFDAVEINSTFYRPHRPQTYERWRETTPKDFRFAVKAPRTITHDARLIDCQTLVATFLDEVQMGLAEKLGPVLVQLPPKLAFDADVVGRFFGALRDRWDGPVACEPRHVSWFEPDADQLLSAHKVARVAADPPRHELGDKPGGWPSLAYWRLHGSPRMYYSPYEEEALSALAVTVASTPAQDVWVMFDNTTAGAAAADALTLTAMMNLRP